MSDADLAARTRPGLESLGWDPTAAPLRDVLPSLSRGNNAVLVAPPSPVYAAPALAGLIERLQPGGLILVLAPTPSLAEWALPVGILTEETGLHPMVVLGPGQAARRLRSGGVCDLLVAAPSTALDLQRRSLLRSEAVTAVLVAWPELWEDQEALSILLQDVSKEAQRVVLTSTPVEIASLIERHAWRGFTLAPEDAPAPTAVVRTVPVAWSRRVGALAELAEALDAESLSIWTADRSRQQEIRRALSGLGVAATVSSERPVPAAFIVAFDPPSPARLVELCAAGAVVLLMPPSTEGYLTRIAPARQPMQLPGALDAATGEGARRRELIERAVRETPLEDPLVLLAPLFERHEPATIAAALYHLWVTAPRQPEKPAEVPVRGLARLWVGVGKKDGVGPNDLVGLLANELQLQRSAIGHIDLRETYSLIELPEADAARIAEAMTGRSVRGRRIVARLDQRDESRERRPVRRAARPR